MLHSLLWAIAPPLFFLAYYYLRIPAATLPKLLVCFVVGAISGFVALGLAWSFEQLANWLVDWDRITQSLAGVALRQLVEVGPIEEGSKLAGVVLFQRWNYSYTQRLCPISHPHRPSTLLLYSIAIALGFTAEENWIYLANDTASVFDRLIGTPVHALFSAPWGYALGIASCSTITSSRYKGAIALAWFNAVICHALVNVLSSAWRYSPLSFLSYGLFPFLLWMFWRLEQLLRRAKGQLPLTLISASTPTHQYWQRGLVIFALMLGGNAIFGIFLLSRVLNELQFVQIPISLWRSLVIRLALDLISGIIAWLIYRYLRIKANRLYRRNTLRF